MDEENNEMEDEGMIEDDTNGTDSDEEIDAILNEKKDSALPRDNI